MSLDRSYPHAGNHSIQNAVLAVEWAPEIDANELAVVCESAHEILLAYPKVDPLQTLRLNVAPAGPSIASIPQVTGYAYSRLSSSGVLQKQIQIGRASCLILVSDYKRWKDLIGEVKAIFAKVTGNLPSGVTITTAGLQYSDRFVWKGAADELDLAEVFRSNSPYLTPHALRCKQPWHSHHGYFEASEDPVSFNGLNNINVDVVDGQDGRAIQILTAHRASLQTPVLAIDAMDSVLALLDALHGLNESVFKQLLSEQLLGKINLS